MPLLPQTSVVENVCYIYGNLRKAPGLKNEGLILALNSAKTSIFLEDSGKTVNIYAVQLYT